mmetsp:Transcript_8446/g.26063  ORF Transcript_8446/g.26063 Transcript_8446/m.26063 type:complete len:268 (-) Transcript_8446:550-1353(-)
MLRARSTACHDEELNARLLPEPHAARIARDLCLAEPLRVIALHLWKGDRRLALWPICAATHFRARQHRRLQLQHRRRRGVGPRGRRRQADASADSISDGGRRRARAWHQLVAREPSSRGRNGAAVCCRRGRRAVATAADAWCGHKQREAVRSRRAKGDGRHVERALRARGCRGRRKRSCGNAGRAGQGGAHWSHAADGQYALHRRCGAQHGSGVPGTAQPQRCRSARVAANLLRRGVRLSADGPALWPHGEEVRRASRGARSEPHAA